jgi:hypothetical protein
MRDEEAMVESESMQQTRGQHGGEGRSKAANSGTTKKRAGEPRLLDGRRKLGAKERKDVATTRR